MIKVLEPGFVTTIQDEGRPGHYKRGIPPSGAMDLESYTLGNALVGNQAGAAALEMTFMGPKLEFTAPVMFAVTGGDMPPSLNGIEIDPWRTHSAEPGDVLSFAFLRSGVRAYLSFHGGIDVPKFLGSRSTHVNSGYGGLNGRKLNGGDVLTLEKGQTGAGRHEGRVLGPEYQPQFATSIELRYVPGLFDYRLSDNGRTVFDNRDWVVTPNADRTGIRLSSLDKTPLEFVDRIAPFGAGSDPSNVVDAGYPIGAIQIPSGVEPIVLSRDAVTAGGYFTVGAVVTADLDALGQAPTHGHVRFRPVTIDEAVDARRSRLNRILTAIDSTL